MYVTQPEVKPGCVLRRANIGLLEKKKLVTDHEVRGPALRAGTQSRRVMSPAGLPWPDAGAHHFDQSVLSAPCQVFMDPGEGTLVPACEAL